MTVLGNAQLVLPDEVMTGSLRIEGGLIAEIIPGCHLPAGAIDCGGDLLLPGLIELHTDNIERHLQPRPKVDWPARQAILAHDGELASAGITTVFDALRVGSVLSNSTSGYYEYARAVADDILDLQRAGALRISHLLHLRAEVCSETLTEELARFGPADQIGILSLMDHTPGQRQFRDMVKLRAYVTGKRSMSDAEFDAHVRSQQGIRARFGAKHEAIALTEAGRLGAVLASHDDTTADQVATSAARGMRFAEFPTTTEAAQACRDAGIPVMMGAPNLIRGGSHSGNVAAAELAAAGLLDLLSSDYVPAALLNAALQLSDLWGDLPRAIRCVTAGPADVTGLADRGRIHPGLRADLIRVRRLDKDSAAIRAVWCGGARVA